jgi:hypothetical protein
MTYKARAVRPIADRIRANVAEIDGCWLYQGALQANGYALVSLGRTAEGRDYLHRVTYRDAHGEIPAGMDIDHLCRNRACCNPEHLEAVSRRVNLLRGNTITAANAAKTHCKRGHEFTEDNTRHDGRGRQCRTCDRIRRGRAA